MRTTFSMTTFSSRALRPVLAALVLATTFALAPIAPAPEAAATTTLSLTTAESEHLELLDKHRRAHGLPPLAVDARAQADARGRPRR